MTIREKMLETLVEIYPAVSVHIREDGAFLNEEGKRVIYDQCTGLFYAALYTEKSEKNPYYHDAETLARAIRCWEYYYTLTLEGGKTQIITQDQYWQDQYEEWDTLHWMTTIELLEPYLDEERLARWKKRCYDSCEGLIGEVRQAYESGEIQKQLKKNSIANHFLWCVVCAYRYAKKMGREDDCALCEEIMEAAAEGQHSSGIWLEGGSLIVGYAHVSYGAAALFCALSGEKCPKLAEATKRCTKYLLNCYYEGCRATAVLDTRMRYEETPGKPGGSAYIPSGLVDDPLMQYYASLAVTGMAEDPVIADSHQLLGYYMQGFLTMPPTAEIRLDPAFSGRDPEFVIPDMRARILRKNGWVVPMCCHEQQVKNSRWILERMNLFSIYRTGVGEIVGGGNSTSTPHLASFEIIQDGRDVYLPEQSELVPDGMSMHYNGAVCTVHFLEISEQRVVVRYHIEGLLETGKAYVHMPLFAANSAAITAAGREYPMRDGEYFSLAVPKGEAVLHRGASITCDHDVILTYPENGFNPYVKKQVPKRGERYAVLACALDYTDHEVIFTVNAPGA